MLAAGGVNTGAVYSFYRIVSATVRALIQSTSSSAGASGIFVIVPSTDYSNLGNVNTYSLQTFQEYPYNTKRHISSTIMNSGVTLKNTMSTKKMWGLRYAASLEDASYDGQFGTNPTALWGWNFAWFPDSSSNSPLGS